MSTLNNLDRFKFLKYGSIPNNNVEAETGMKLVSVLELVTEGLDRSEAWDILQIMKNACTWYIRDDKTEALYEILEHCDSLEKYKEKNRSFYKYLKRRKAIFKIEPDDIIESFTFDLKGIVAYYTGLLIFLTVRYRAEGSKSTLKLLRTYTKNLIEYLERKNDENR